MNGAGGTTSSTVTTGWLRRGRGQEFLEAHGTEVEDIAAG